MLTLKKKKGLKSTTYFIPYGTWKRRKAKLKASSRKETTLQQRENREQKTIEKANIKPRGGSSKKTKTKKRHNGKPLARCLQWEKRTRTQ